MIDWAKFWYSVDVDPKRRGGQPVLRGTRFTVSQIFAELADGNGPLELAENFALNEEGIRDLLRRMAQLIEMEEV